MTKLSRWSLFWAPRVLSSALIVFLSLFALDVFNEGYGFWKTLLALGLHLIPCFALIVALILAWRWEWIGAVLYGAAGMLYVVMVLMRPLRPTINLNSMVSIAGPAFVVATLFLVDWLKRGELHVHRT